MSMGRRGVVLAAVGATAAVAAGAVVAFALRSPAVRLNGSIGLISEGEDWSRGSNDDCAPANAATVFKPGAEVTFVGTDEENRGRFTISQYVISMGGAGVDCRAFFNGVTLHGDDPRYVIRVDGVSVSVLERGRIDAAIDPDLGGLGINVTGCATICKVNT